MKQKRHMTEEIICILREIDGGKDPHVARSEYNAVRICQRYYVPDQHNVAEATQRTLASSALAAM